MSTAPGQVAQTPDVSIASGEVVFTDLVHAHWRLQGAHVSQRTRVELEERYRAVLDAFVHQHGELIEVYWASTSASAVALTAPPRTKLGRLLRLGAPSPRIYRVSDWAMAQDPKTAALLHRCDVAAIRAGQGLSSVATRVALRWIFITVADLIARSDGNRSTRVGRDIARADSPDGEAEAGAALDDPYVERDVQRLEAYVRQAAGAATLRTYVVGLLAGLASVVLGTFVVEIARTGTPYSDSAAIAIVVGALGATVSAAQRAGGVGGAPPAEMGRSATLLLGMIRSWIGGIFGAGVYVLLATGVVVLGGPPSKLLYSAVAFAAGFAERFARSYYAEAGSDLHEFAGRAVSHAAAEIPDAVEATIRAALQGPRLTNWEGWVSATLDGSVPNVVENGTDAFEPGAPVTLRLRFVPASVASSSVGDGDGDVVRTIAIRDGVYGDPVQFDLRFDSDSILFPDTPNRLFVPVNRTQDAITTFPAPNTSGRHRLWVHVMQENRVVQLIPAEFEVR